jgi:hypothetical protein
MGIKHFVQFSSVAADANSASKWIAAKVLRFRSLRPPSPLCCAVLCCAVLCCAVLCCAVLCCALETTDCLLPAVCVGAAQSEAESVVRAFLPESTILRLGHLYGEEDRFINRLAQLAATSGIPVLEEGTGKLQPVDAIDVANCVLNALAIPEAQGATYHLGGDTRLTWKELSELVYRGMILTSSTVHMSPVAIK